VVQQARGQLGDVLVGVGGVRRHGVSSNGAHRALTC
jgi:hypothetical protein